MKTILFIFAAALLPLSGYAAIKGINRPDKVIKLKGQKCHIFKKFIVVERLSGKQGADRIAVRTLKNSSPKSACSASNMKDEVVLDISRESLYGSKSDFIFTESFDSPGQLKSMKVYSINSPRSLQTLNYHGNKDIIVTELRDSLSIEFFSRLKLSCSLAAKGNECWEKIKKENGISNDIVDRPLCDEVYSGHAFQTSPELKNNPDAVQVYALVKVPDVRARESIYLKAQATCDAAL